MLEFVAVLVDYQILTTHDCRLTISAIMTFLSLRLSLSLSLFTAHCSLLAANSNVHIPSTIALTLIL